MKDFKRKISLFLAILLFVGSLGSQIITTYGADGEITEITDIELTKKPTLVASSYTTSDRSIALVLDVTGVDATYVDKMVASPSEATYILTRYTTPVEFTYEIATSSNATPSDVTIIIDNSNLSLKSGLYTLTVEVVGYEAITYSFYITSSSGSGSSGSGSSSSGSSSSSSSKGSWKQDAKGWWYVLPNGTYPVNKWMEINGHWYYFDNVGYMVTGWLQYNNHWYFLYDSGDMATNWIQYNNKWYFLYDSGDMATGWLLYKGQWYFLNSSGDMATSTTIDGYRVNENGVWVQ